MRPFALLATMRILTHLYSLERLGGIEVNTLEVCRALALRGHDIHVLHGARLSGSSTPDMRTDFDAAGVALHGPVRFSSPPPSRAVPAIASFLPAARLAARLQPDVVWLQRFEQILWGQTIARRSRAPLVCHLHHAPAYGLQALPFLARGVTRFVAVSQFMRHEWVVAGLDADRVDMVHNAAPPQSYPAGGERERRAARRDLGLPPEVPTVLYYGRLTADKGLGVLLDAWAAGSMAEDALLVLAGDGPPESEPLLAGRVAAAVATGSVAVLPAQRDVVPLLHAADLVVFPTLLPEAFGRVVLEGLMTGRPVLASDAGGVGEILAGPLAQLLVPPGDSTAVSAGVTSLLGWRRDKPELGPLCSSESLARFSFSGHVDRMEEILSAAASAGRTGRRSGR